MAQPQTIICPRCRSENRGTARFCQKCGHDMVLNNAGPRYYLTRVIKAGGQGAVYEGVDDSGAVYAVKEMLDDFADAKERAAGIARFEAEAELLESLAHPRIPRVYAHFEDEGKHYLVMDFVRGEDLAEVVGRAGAIPERRVLEWADQICDVLGHLHGLGMIYRDMKPSNVMLEPSGSIKLIDFGIAKVLKGAQRGTQIGTPGYAPPEQYQGIATPRSDIYALGATLHHLLTGRDPQDEAPFTFPPARDIAPSVSQRTSDALAHALQMRPEDRFASLEEFATALGLRSAPPPLVKPAPAAPPPAPANRRGAGAAPAVPVPGAPAPSPAPSRPAPPAPSAPAAPPGRRGARPAPAAPAATPAPPAAAPPAPKTAGVTCLARVVPVLALIGVVAAGIYAFAAGWFPAPGQAAPTSTAQTLVQQEFRTEAEIIVPAGTDAAGLLSAYEYTFGVLAAQQFGAGTQVVPGSVGYADGGQPAYLGADTQGERFRATVVGQVLVPEQ